MEVFPVQEDLSSICEAILRTLPEWFGLEDALQNYIKGVRECPMFVAVEQGHNVGFLSLKILEDRSAEIFVMGVRPEYHRKGIGRALVQEVEAYLVLRGIKTLFVKTLDSRRKNEAYEKTRQFYLSVGFQPERELPDIWGKENPCLLMQKVVQCPQLKTRSSSSSAGEGTSTCGSHRKRS